MICPYCKLSLSGKDVVCTCRRKRNSDELFQKDKRFIVETKNVESEKEVVENEQTEIPDAESNKRDYGKGKHFTKKDVFPN